MEQGTDKKSLKALSSCDFKLQENILLANNSYINQEGVMKTLRAIVWQAQDANNKPRILATLDENNFDLIDIGRRMAREVSFLSPIQIHQRKHTQTNDCNSTHKSSNSQFKTLGFNW